MKQYRTLLPLALIALFSCSIMDAQKLIVQYKINESRLASKKRDHYRKYHVRIEFSGGKTVEDIKLDPPSATSISGKHEKIIHNLVDLGNVTSMKITEMGTELMQESKPEIIAMINSLIGKDKPDIILSASVKVKKTSSKFAIKDAHRHTVHFKLEVFPKDYNGPHWTSKEEGKKQGFFTNGTDFYATRNTVDLRKKLK